MSRHAPYRHLICDFDGVLSDSMAIACKHINSIAKSHSFAIPPAASQEDLAVIYHGPLKTSLQRFGLSVADCAQFFNLHSAAMEAEATNVHPFFDVLDALVNVAATGRLSIITSAYSTAVRAILAKSPAFSEALPAASIYGREMRQPKDAKILVALRAAGVAPSDSLHMADMVSDIIYSRQVPIDVVAVGWGYHPVEYLRRHEPDYVLATTGALPRFLEEHLAPHRR